jgi:hypothetical protein
METVFENRVLGEYLGIKGRKCQKTGGGCIMGAS